MMAAARWPARNEPANSQLFRRMATGRNVAKRQPNEFGRRIVAREMPARLDDLAQARVDALDRIRDGSKARESHFFGRKFDALIDAERLEPSIAAYERGVGMARRCLRASRCEPMRPLRAPH